MSSRNASGSFPFTNRSSKSRSFICRHPPSVPQAGGFPWSVVVCGPSTSRPLPSDGRESRAIPTRIRPGRRGAKARNEPEGVPSEREDVRGEGPKNEGGRFLSGLLNRAGRASGGGPSGRHSLIGTFDPHRVGREGLGAERQVVGDDPDDLVVVEVGLPDRALGVLLLLLVLLELLLLGLPRRRRRGRIRP